MQKCILCYSALHKSTIKGVFPKSTARHYLHLDQHLFLQQYETELT